jgi:hypothetical protein
MYIQMSRLVFLVVTPYGFAVQRHNPEDQHQHFNCPKKFNIIGLYIYISVCQLYSSPDITRQVKSRRMRWAAHVARMGEERKVYKVLVGKPEGKRPLGRPRRR